MTLDRNQWIGIGLLSGLALLWKRDKIGAESFDAEDEHDCEYKRGLFSILESDYGGDRNDTINSVAEDFGFTSCFECARNHSTFRRDCKHLCPECREISEGCWCDYCEQCEEKPLDCKCDNKDAESFEAEGEEFYVVVKKEGQVMANVIHRTFNLEEAIDYAERLWSDGIYEEVEVDCPDAETVVWMNGEWEDAWLELNAESFDGEDIVSAFRGVSCDHDWDNGSYHGGGQMVVTFNCTKCGTHVASYVSDPDEGVVCGDGEIEVCDNCDEPKSTDGWGDCSCGWICTRCNQETDDSPDFCERCDCPECGEDNKNCECKGAESLEVKT